MSSQTLKGGANLLRFGGNKMRTEATPLCAIHWMLRRAQTLSQSQFSEVHQRLLTGVEDASLAPAAKRLKS